MCQHGQSFGWLLFLQELEPSNMQITGLHVKYYIVTIVLVN